MHTDTHTPGLAVLPQVHLEYLLHILDPTLKLVKLNRELNILGGAVEHLF
jgi:hypothetical protein